MAQTAPKQTSFVTADGKIHFAPHKVEAVIQVICVLGSFGGAALVWSTAEDENRIANPDEIGYSFAAGVLLTMGLLFNAGAHLPISTPMLMGIGYFYFPKCIMIADEFAHNNDVNDKYYEAYDKLMTGAVLSLFFVSVGCVLEISVPGSGQGRNSGCGGTEIGGVLFTLFGIVGLLIMWSGLDYNGQASTEYLKVVKLTIEALLAFVFLADTMLHFDVYIANGAVLIGMYTSMYLFCEGVEYDTAPDDDTKMARQGALLAATSMFILVVIVVIMTGLKRNENASDRRRGF